MRKIILFLSLALSSMSAFSEVNADLACYTCISDEDFAKVGAAQIYNDFKFGTNGNPLDRLFPWETVSGDKIRVVNPLTLVIVDLNLNVRYNSITIFNYAVSIPDFSAVDIEISRVGSFRTYSITVKNSEIYNITVLDPRGERGLTPIPTIPPLLEGVSADELNRLAAIRVTPEQYKRLSVAYDIEALENLADLLPRLSEGGFDRFINMSDQELAGWVRLKNIGKNLDISGLRSGPFVFTTRTFGAINLGTIIGSYSCGSNCSDRLGY